MTANAGAIDHKFTNWNSISWAHVDEHVRRLQLRIAKAAREGKNGRVKALQWILTHSYYAKLLAVKRVTENKGKNTPGIDGIVWKTVNEKLDAVDRLDRRSYKSKPLRRIYIPKKNGKKRPLSIPVMADRAWQALHLLALLPVTETTADNNSYGFRPKRQTADAIEQCFHVLCRKQSAKWILEGDIKACFDGICHKWLLEHVPMDRKVLQQWLSAGYVDKNQLYATQAGTPQGGIASPCLANIALDGLEAIVMSVAPPNSKVNFVRYADDFIVTCNSDEVLRYQVKPAIENFLMDRGLTLSEEKTTISHINDGFDFLGQNVRKYQDKLLITPSKESSRSVLLKVKSIINTHRGLATDVLIRKLNPVIRGWAYFHRHVVSKASFSYIRHRIFKFLWRWAIRRHPHKGKRWIRRKYFKSIGGDNWVFSCAAVNKEGPYVLRLFDISAVSIRRHIKVKAKATPFDPDYDLYWSQRKFCSLQYMY